MTFWCERVWWPPYDLVSNSPSNLAVRTFLIFISLSHYFISGDCSVGKKCKRSHVASCSSGLKKSVEGGGGLVEKPECHPPSIRSLVTVWLHFSLDPANSLKSSLFNIVFFFYFSFFVFSVWLALFSGFLVVHIEFRCSVSVSPSAGQPPADEDEIPWREFTRARDQTR